MYKSKKNQKKKTKQLQNNFPVRNFVVGSFFAPPRVMHAEDIVLKTEGRAVMISQRCSLPT